MRTLGLPALHNWISLLHVNTLNNFRLHTFGIWFVLFTGFILHNWFNPCRHLLRLVSLNLSGSAINTDCGWYPCIYDKDVESNILQLVYLSISSPGLGTIVVNNGFPGGSDGKESTWNTGDLGLTPGLGRSPGEGHDNPLQYPCLENPMDRGTWRATVHRVAKRHTQLSD